MISQVFIVQSGPSREAVKENSAWEKPECESWLSHLLFILNVFCLENGGEEVWFKRLLCRFSETRKVVWECLLIHEMAVVLPTSWWWCRN